MKIECILHASRRDEDNYVIIFVFVSLLGCCSGAFQCLLTQCPVLENLGKDYKAIFK